MVSHRATGIVAVQHQQCQRGLRPHPLTCVRTRPVRAPALLADHLASVIRPRRCHPVSACTESAPPRWLARYPHASCSLSSCNANPQAEDNSDAQSTADIKFQTSTIHQNKRLPTVPALPIIIRRPCATPASNTGRNTLFQPANKSISAHVWQQNRPVWP